MRNKIVAFISNRIVRNLAFMVTAWLAAYWFIDSNFIAGELDRFEKERLLQGVFWLLVTIFINPFYNLWRKN